jgi:PAS domain S-box-containing protein
MIEDATGAPGPPSGPPSSEERYRLLFEYSPVAIWEEDLSGVRVLLDGLRASGVADLETHLASHPDLVARCAEAIRIVDVNAAGVALHRAPSKAALLAGLRATFTPESFATFRRELVALWRGRTAFESDGVVQTLAGERRRVTVSFAVCPGHERTLARVFVSVVDVTERGRAEEALRAAEERYREVFENASDAMVILEVTEGGRFPILAVNCAFERSTGVSAARAVGRTQAEIVAPDIAVLLEARYRRCVETGETVHEGVELELPGGRRSYDSTLVPLRDADGTIRRILGISRDVTGHKQSLAEIEDLYDNAPCGYHSLDASGRYVRVNEVEAQWLGYQRDELIGRVRFAELLTPASAEAFRREFAALEAGGSIGDLEVELVRRDGSLLPAMIRASAVRDQAGRFVMCRTTVIDLTARRKVEEQLRQAQKLEAVARLAGGVAHDFNNVLTVILSATRDMIDTVPEGHPVRPAALEVEEAAERAVALTRQLLTFSRRQPAEARVLDLDQVTAGMDKMLRRIIGEDIELAVASDGAPHRVRADPGLMEQVLVNLAVNARDAMPRGGRLTVETRAVRAGEERPLGEVEQVCLAVRDTGAGMPPEVVAHLFEPFFTTKERGKGTGLGLSTVYGIVKQSGGEIRVETGSGRGSAFLVYLPAVSDPVAAPPPSRAAEEGAQPAPGGDEVILVAEDEPRVRALVARSLRILGYDVLEATHGEEALRLAAASGRVDLLVTDAVMPRMGGVELADRLRLVRPGMRVLFVSGYLENGAAAPTGPGVAFLEKPFTPVRLARKVRELLDRPRR